MNKNLKFLLGGVILTLVVGIPLSNSYGQPYSKLSIWTERGVWIGAHGGASIPVGDEMRDFHGNGYSGFISFEFPRTFFDIGVETGVQQFAETDSFTVANIIPVNVYFRFNLIKTGSPAENRGFRLKTGAGGGVFISQADNDNESYLGIYVPLVFRYRLSEKTRMDFEVRGYEVFGDMATGSGDNRYLDLQLSFHLFIPY